MGILLHLGFTFIALSSITNTCNSEPDTCYDIRFDQHLTVNIEDPHYLSDTTCCARGFDRWYYKKYAFDSPPMPGHLQFENYTDWESICSRWHAAAVCVQSVNANCDIDWALHVLRNRTYLIYSWMDKFGPTPHYAFYDRTCEKGKVAPAVRKTIYTMDFTPSCLSGDDINMMLGCFNYTSEILQHDRLHDISNDMMEYYKKLAAAAIRCMRELVKKSSCNDVSKEFYYHLVNLQIPSIINITTLQDVDTSTVNFASPRRCSVGVYGDPHLRLCNDPRLYTCSAPGRQLYLSNKYLHIEGNNEYIGPQATTLMSIEIIFKSVDGSTEIGRYKAEEGRLPVSFVGTHLNRIGRGTNKVILSAYHYSQVQLIYDSLGIVIMVQHWGVYYFFTVRMTEQLAKESYGLLGTGCPWGELIGRGGFIHDRGSRRNKRYVSACQNACQPINDTSFQEACLFDCMMVGNPQIVTMTTEALKDIKQAEKLDKNIIARALEITTTTTTTTSTTTSATIRNDTLSSTEAPETTTHDQDDNQRPPVQMDSYLNVGLIIGMVVLAIAVIIIIFFTVYFAKRYLTKSASKEKEVKSTKQMHTITNAENKNEKML